MKVSYTKAKAKNREEGAARRAAGSGQRAAGGAVFGIVHSVKAEIGITTF